MRHLCALGSDHYPYGEIIFDSAFHIPALLRDSIQNGDTLFRFAQISNMLSALLKGICSLAVRAWPRSSVGFRTLSTVLLCQKVRHQGLGFFARQDDSALTYTCFLLCTFL